MWYLAVNGFEKEYNHPAVNWIFEQAFAESRKKSGNEIFVLDYVMENIEKYNYANSLVDGLKERKKWINEEILS